MRDPAADRPRPRWPRVVGVLVVLVLVLAAGQLAKHRVHPVQATTAVSPAPQTVAPSTPPTAPVPTVMTVALTPTSIDQPDAATRRLTTGCAPTAVRQLLSTVVTAFNQGSAATLRRVWRGEGGIGWFQNAGLDLDGPSFAAVHAHHGTLRLLSFHPGDLQVVQRTFTATLDENADGHPATRAAGSGVVTCATGVPQLMFLEIDPATR